MRKLYDKAGVIKHRQPQQGKDPKMNAEYAPVESAQIAADMGNIGRVEKLVERVQRPAVTNAHNMAICGALYPKLLQKWGSHKRIGKHGNINRTTDRGPP